MAMYQLDNRVLDEDEYRREVAWWWRQGLFLVGLALGAALAHPFASEALSLPKWGVFTVVCAAGLGVGVVLALLQRYIRTTLLVGAGLGLVALLGMMVWEVV